MPQEEDPQAAAEEAERIYTDYVEQEVLHQKSWIMRRGQHPVSQHGAADIGF